MTNDPAKEHHMKSFLSTCLLVLLIAQAGQSQLRYSTEKYQSYLKWFNYHTAIKADRLISFLDNVPVYERPDTRSKLISNLVLGEAVIAAVTPDEVTITEVINGFRDSWVKINICDAKGIYQQAYVWRGHLAKNWQYYDIDQDGLLELIALGTTTNHRRGNDHIAAELRVIKGKELISSVQLPGFCLFEDCQSNSILRLLKVGTQLKVLEASVFTKGALSGIDKALIIWENNHLRLIHRAEFITGHTYQNDPFYYQHNNTVRVCHYQGENDSFDPVWNCKVMDTTVAVP
jgi:hypothetical protein